MWNDHIWTLSHTRVIDMDRVYSKFFPCIALHICFMCKNLQWYKVLHSKLLVNVCSRWSLSFLTWVYTSEQHQMKKNHKQLHRTKKKEIIWITFELTTKESFTEMNLTIPNKCFDPHGEKTNKWLEFFFLFPFPLLLHMEQVPWMWNNHMQTLSDMRVTWALFQSFYHVLLFHICFTCKSRKWHNLLCSTVSYYSSCLQ